MACCRSTRRCWGWSWEGTGCWGAAWEAAASPLRTCAPPPPPAPPPAPSPCPSGSTSAPATRSGRSGARICEGDIVPCHPTSADTRHRPELLHRPPLITPFEGAMRVRKYRKCKQIIENVTCLDKLTNLVQPGLSE